MFKCTKVYDAGTGNKEIWGLAIKKDDSIIYSGGQGEQFRVYDTQTGELLNKQQVPQKKKKYSANETKLQFFYHILFNVKILYLSIFSEKACISK
jgi:hypothetical protein